MNITVTAGSWARAWLPGDKVQLTLPHPAVVQDVLAALNFPADEVGLFAINGIAVPQDTPLNDGDTVRLFPVAMGG
ncbi:MAG: MoaD/ThiS family protein [Oscillospiraceae bacterium]|nr:MoaD/ThiS family protein [Oscillospiraceae bacterium]